MAAAQTPHAQVMEAIGRVDERLKAVERDVGEVKSSATEMRTRQSAMANDLASAHGGLRVLRWVGGVLVAVGTAATALWDRIAT